MSSGKDVLEERYVVIKLKDLNDTQAEALNDVMGEMEIKRRGGVVIEKDWPGYDVAVGIALHGRVCRRFSACSCKKGEREACFDWVKV